MPAIQAMTAMTWNAFSHSYILCLPAHPLDHALNILDRCFRQNAVAEIENKRAVGECLLHVVDGAIQRRKITGISTAAAQYMRTCTPKNVPTANVRMTTCSTRCSADWP